MNTPAPLALFGSLGTWEAVVIAVVVLILFGNRIPAVMRSLGRGVVEFKKGISETPDDTEKRP
jgi:sec-independent protein translocase protein TatA